MVATRVRTKELVTHPRLHRDHRCRRAGHRPPHRAWRSLLRRLIPILTSRHEIEIGGRVVASVQQKFRFFIKEFHVDQAGLVFGDDDPRMVLCVLLAVVMESHRENG